MSDEFQNAEETRLADSLSRMKARMETGNVRRNIDYIEEHTDPEPETVTKPETPKEVQANQIMANYDFSEEGNLFVSDA